MACSEPSKGSLPQNGNTIISDEVEWNHTCSDQPFSRVNSTQRNRLTEEKAGIHPATKTDERRTGFVDLSALNTCRLILDAIGKEKLSDIVNDVIDLLDTSVAVYEKNGDYALGIVHSHWCRFLNEKSFRLCNTDDVQQALASGNWHCHESCWTECSRECVETGAVVDIACRGGLRIYSVPIRANGDIIGAINMGYGEPPQDRQKLEAIAYRYHIRIEELPEQAKTYWSRSPQLIKIAKNHLHSAATLIGTIVAQQQTLKALAASEKRYRLLVENQTDLIVEFDHEYRLVFVSPNYCKTFGKTEAELIGQPFVDFILAEDQSKVLSSLQKLKSPPHITNHEERMRTKDGWRWFEWSAEAVIADNGEMESIISVGRDITARKKNEKALQLTLEISRQKQKEFLSFLAGSRAVLESSQFDKVARNLFGICKELIKASSGYIALLSADGAENEVLFLDAGGLPCLVDPNLPMPIRGLRADAYHRKKVVYENDFHYSDWMEYIPEGHVRLDNVLFAPLIIEDQVVGLMGLANKATGFNEHDAELARVFGGLAAIALRNSRNYEALTLSEERYRSLYISMREGAALHEILYDGAGNATDYVILDVNPAFESIMGRKKESVVGKKATAVYGTDEPPYLDHYETVVKTGQPQSFETAFDPMGKQFAISVFSPAPNRFATVFEDITERKHMEEQLRQSQKMEAIGKLAGGIAHDFNNLLMAILGYSDLILNDLKENDPLRDEISEIKKAGERAASLTRQLLAFSRKQILQPKLLDLNTLILDLNRMLRRLINENIELIILPDSSLGMVKADPGQLEQIIMNLTVNARDAMPNGGKLIIQTKQRNREDAPFLSNKVPTGAYAVISIRDTGCGMDEETQKRIFDPFFTTKKMGEGTGLGLSTVYGIVKQSGGDIQVFSQPGKGTTFEIYLPCAACQSEASSPAKQSLESLRGTETILLTEDEAIVRNLMIRMLKEYGYHVIAASYGSEALKLCETNPQPIHLLLTDLVMPGMSGRELAEILSVKYPDMKILFMSGYTDDAIIRSGAFNGNADFVHKPASPEKLIKKIRELLDKPGCKQNE
ncbi:MAG: PAS domain S-box protein [Candidatus Omnitrophota bacterium]|jgi:PAS domain S-box-containing protein|nr:MAG: PAS domain S-box protein [Candidatus Omnitrophota bacterium]